MGRSLARPRGLAPHALAFEVRGLSERLWLDASRRAAGVYLVARGVTAAIEERDPEALPGRDRHALLLVRKHLDGRRLHSIEAAAGGRAVVLELGGPLLALRLAGTPALSLVLEGRPVASLGEGAVAWPLPQSPPVPKAAAAARPLLALPAPLASASDRDLVAPGAVRFVASSAGAAGVLEPASWIEAAAVWLLARRRGARFESAQRRALQQAGREARRLARLEQNLAADLAGLPDADALRRQAEAILAHPGSVAAGAAEARVPDPWDESATLRVVLEPRLDAHANASRLFARARRIERSRDQVASRLIETRRELAVAQQDEARAAEARELRDLVARAEEPRGPGQAKGGARHYLTTRGLSVLVGRGARENHHLTFSIARPDDLWLHARDVPGSHVILRDPEGRAGADDLREAAEVAAFFSDARSEPRADVHVTRRKHLRPARGGPGRVHVFHSETMRVSPRDPEGRLRRR